MNLNAFNHSASLASGLLHVKKYPKIDMHVHYIPQEYRSIIGKYEGKYPDGFATPSWSVEDHLKFNKKMNIQTSLLSLSSPHFYFGDDEETRKVAHKVNTVGAEISKKYPENFQLLGSLPLPNIKNSIAEIEYAIKELHVLGFTLPTNTKGHYLGQPELDPILEKLNQYKSIVFLHPNEPGKVPDKVNEGLSVPAMEFLFDTTRTVINMTIHETFKRYPDIKFIIPHGGAFLSLLADRMDSFFKTVPVNGKKINVDIYATIKHLYYDVAGFPIPRQLEAMLSLVDTDHLLYGSDYPYTPSIGCEGLAGQLSQTRLLSEREKKDIFYNNAYNLVLKSKSIEN
ncbi:MULTISPECIES: amidohydrolase family protein [Liquorilactobacillus]|uniref:amidohydrolase family protein n=1 Tax=Liquorilactobacillus TaxID=2767888 RepID=UPI0021C3D453|nr:amidohydrolase family protein [Liquorilactobacillus satsumensis]MCP9328682.1 amidohydrolase [Liquorilactobacillus satsumensis]